MEQEPRIPLGAEQRPEVEPKAPDGDAPEKLHLDTAAMELLRGGKDSDGDARKELRLGTTAMELLTGLNAPGGNVPADLQRSLTQYRVRELLGRGGMGQVMEVDDPKLSRTVALKVMKLGPAASEEQRGRFVREATVLARLAHPNIVPIYDLGMDGQGQLFYTMKLVKGRTLQAIIDDLRMGAADGEKEHPLERLLAIFRKVCDALAFAHSKRVVHRDLKPENIMVGEFGEVLVMDWGLAKLLPSEEEVSKSAALRGALAAQSRGFTDEEAADLFDAAGSWPPLEQSCASLGTFTVDATLEGALMGTPQYMSPEQANGKVAEIDERSDIFSLGAIFYAILTLHPPVNGKSVSEVLMKISTGQIAPPSNFGAIDAKPESRAARSKEGEVIDTRMFRPLPHCPGGRVPAALSAVTMKALSLDKGQRYQSVNEFSADVEAWQSGFATRAENASPRRQIMLLIQRHIGVFSTAVAAWLIITTLAAWFVIGVTRAKKHAESARDRANETLAELRGTAPTFAAQASALVDAGRPGDALAKLGYAIRLDPKNPAYQLQRAHLLEAGQHLAEAAQGYRATLALDPANRSARENLALCERLQNENAGAPELRRELQIELVDALLHEGRAVEAGPLAAQLGHGLEAIEAALRARLKEYTAQPGWSEERIQRQPDGTFLVGLDGMKLGDLSVLRGFPISSLKLWATGIQDMRIIASLPLTVLSIGGENANVTDLSPLRGLKLEKLFCGGCRITDIEPIRGMPLRELNLNNTRVTDLSSLEGMPLQELGLVNLKAKNLAPLRGLPLRHLNLAGAQGDADMAVLAGCQLLEDIVIPRDAVHIEALRALPKLAALRLEGHQDVLIPAKEFWAEFKPEMEAVGSIRLALKTAGIPLESTGSVVWETGGTVNVALYGEAVSDLEFLRGMPVSKLRIGGTKVRDLAPLRGMPLKNFYATLSAVTNLEPLRGLPLISICLEDTHITSVAPLADCPELETVVLPHDARDVSALRKLPKLRGLTYNEGSLNSPNGTAEQFWKEFDARRKGAEK